jgi:hypothetical protein
VKQVIENLEQAKLFIQNITTRSNHDYLDRENALACIGWAISHLNVSPEENKINLTGVERIAAERKRQIEEEGWTEKHDDQWEHGELAEAAATYASLPHWEGRFINWRKILWPWDDEWYKPETDRIRELEKAGALIAAEIDRLLRQEIKF